MEQLDYNLLFRWFVGLEIDDRVWDATAGMFWHQFGLSKQIPVTERIKGMLRVEFTAPFKYPFFSPPGSTVDFRNPQTFGKITAQQGGFSGLGARTMTTAIFRVQF
jgi:hypothetical protein